MINRIVEDIARVIDTQDNPTSSISSSIDTMNINNVTAIQSISSVFMLV